MMFFRIFQARKRKIDAPHILKTVMTMISI